MKYLISMIAILAASSAHAAKETMICTGKMNSDSKLTVNFCYESFISGKKLVPCKNEAGGAFKIEINRYYRGVLKETVQFPVLSSFMEESSDRLFVDAFDISVENLGAEVTRWVSVEKGAQKARLQVVLSNEFQYLFEDATCR